MPGLSLFPFPRKRTAALLSRRDRDSPACCTSRFRDTTPAGSRRGSDTAGNIPGDTGARPPRAEDRGLTKTSGDLRKAFPSRPSRREAPRPARTPWRNTRWIGPPGPCTISPRSCTSGTSRRPRPARQGRSHQRPPPPAAPVKRGRASARGSCATPSTRRSRCA